MILRFRIQAESDRARAKCAVVVNRVILRMNSWLVRIPIPTTRIKQAVQPKVRPSHLGVVSSSRPEGRSICLVLLP